MSPFCPSFPPQLDPFPRSPQALSPLSTAFTPNRSLTPLSTAFTQTHRGVGYECVGLRQSRVTRHGTRPSFSRILSKITIRKRDFHALLTTFRMNTCKSVSKQRTLTTFRMNTYAKTGGEGAVSSDRLFLPKVPPQTINARAGSISRSAPFAGCSCPLYPRSQPDHEVPMIHRYFRVLRFLVIVVAAAFVAALPSASPAQDRGTRFAKPQRIHDHYGVAAG